MSTLVVDDAETISRILATARKINRENNVSGMLLICDQNVIQVLERAQNAVLSTFKRIEC